MKRWSLRALERWNVAALDIERRRGLPSANPYFALFAALREEHSLASEQLHLLLVSYVSH